MRLAALVLLLLTTGAVLAQGVGVPGSRPVPAVPAAERAVPAPPRIPEPTPRQRAYNRAWHTLYFAGAAWDLAGLALLAFVGAGARIRDLVERRVRGSLPRAVLFYAAFTLLAALWHFPVSLAGYGIERVFGFATHSAGLWLLDRGRAWALGLVHAPALWVALLLMQWSPRRWWLWLWAAAVPWSLALTVVYPVVFDPVYNRFTPLPDSPLRRRIDALAERAGIGGAQVLRVDISRRTRKLNAYVSGLGPTRRIVLWDTTLEALSDDEILAIVGHEIGHYVLRHVWWTWVFGAAGALGVLWMLSWMLPWAVRRWGGRLGARSIHDLAAVPMALLLLSLLLFLQTPVERAISRAQERQADRYGLELTGLNMAMARALVAFVERDYADPDPHPFIAFWLYSHPPIRERVAFALTYGKRPSGLRAGHGSWSGRLREGGA